jgi:hypothetical protein
MWLRVSSSFSSRSSVPSPSNAAATATKRPVLATEQVHDVRPAVWLPSQASVSIAITFSQREYKFSTKLSYPSAPSRSTNTRIRLEPRRVMELFIGRNVKLSLFMPCSHIRETEVQIHSFWTSVVCGLHYETWPLVRLVGGGGGVAQGQLDSRLYRPQRWAESFGNENATCCCRGPDPEPFGP